MDMTPPNIPSSGDGEMGRTIDMSGYPHAKKIRRARIAEDWYACAGAQGALVGWVRIVNPNLTIEIDTVVSDADIYETTFVEQERIVLRDPLGTINNSLLAVEKDGLFYIPEGHEVYCYQPEDAVDGHYEPLNFGTSCEEEGSGSGEDSGSGSGEDEEDLLFGKMDEEIGPGETKPMSIWGGDEEELEDTTEDVEVKDWLLASGQVVETGKKVIVQRYLGKLYIIAAECDE